MIFNLGSINADHFYEVPHLPQPGETLAATAFSTGLGGKGANMSVAAARAGSEVTHIGAVGRDGRWAVERMASYGVNTDQVAVVDAPTAHAIINLDPQGENAIVIYPGANAMQSEERIRDALAGATQADLLLLQNETNLQSFAAGVAKDHGMKVLYAAAPFEEDAVRAVLPYVDILMLNEIEMGQLREATGLSPADLGVETVIVTQGAEGGVVFDHASAFSAKSFVAPKVTAVDTTGAGDTFTGYLAAGLDQDLGLDAAIERAAAAAALKVTKKGTADAIPLLEHVKAFLS